MILGENVPSDMPYPFLCSNEPFFSPHEQSREGTKEASHQKNAEKSPKSCGLEIRQEISCSIVCLAAGFPFTAGLVGAFHFAKISMEHLG